MTLLNDYIYIFGLYKKNKDFIPSYKIWHYLSINLT